MSSDRRIVSFHYNLKNPEGSLLDTSRGGDPIVYLEGAGMIIDGLDEALRSANPGDKGIVDVPAAKGYGDKDPAQIQDVPRDRIPVEGELKVGDQFQTGPDAGAPVVTVVAVDETTVTLDANHPMAGVDLRFEVEVMNARLATPAELDAGKPLPIEDQS